MRALWIAAGIGVWALHFAVVYAVTAIACARAAPHLVPWSIAATYLAMGKTPLSVAA